MATNIEKQLEIYRHKKYRRGRLRFYGLIIIAVSLLATVFGLILISRQPIDVTNIRNAESALEVAHEEYGDTYIKTLQNLPTIGYESQYKALKDTYIELLTEDSRVEDRHKVALDLVVFVEFVGNDAVGTSQKYRLNHKSQEFTQKHQEYGDEHGEVHHQLVKLIDLHTDGTQENTTEQLMSIVNDLDARMEMYINYLTTLKNT